jgi:hypothetical protein
MDSRARSFEGATQYRLKFTLRTLVTKLDAMEGGQLLRACRKHLAPNSNTTHLT